MEDGTKSSNTDRRQYLDGRPLQELFAVSHIAKLGAWLGSFNIIMVLVQFIWDIRFDVPVLGKVKEKDFPLVLKNIFFEINIII